MLSNKHCKKCNSPRKGSTCWKCGTVTFTPCKGWVDPKLPPVNLIRQLAREVGYAIGEHGSKERDLDLIAVPWVAPCISVSGLIAYIAQGVNGELVGTFEKKPHGRKGKTIRNIPDGKNIGYTSINAAEKASHKLQLENDGGLGRGCLVRV